MATKRITIKYGIAAVVIALAVIGGSLYMTPKTAKAQTSFSVMLTDPPNVPTGTTNLEVTYSSIQVHVNYADGTSNWVASQESGTVDLLGLVGVSQTIAELNLPTGSSVDKVMFKITSSNAMIDGTEHPVTILSETLVVNLRGVTLDGTNAGALIDLRPKLLKINAVDADGTHISYYVLVPSATAIDKSNIAEEHKRIGARRKLNDYEENELEEEFEHANRNVDVQATIEVDGDTTTLEVTFTNNGEKNAIINGLEIHGAFKINNKMMQDNEVEDRDEHSRSIPFRVTTSALVPRIGGEDDKDQEKGLELKPGESKPLTFTGVIQVQPHKHGDASMIISLIEGEVYKIRTSGQGSKLIEVTASS